MAKYSFTLLVLLALGGASFAQVRLVPKRISFQLPVHFLSEDFSNCDGYHQIIAQDSGELNFTFDESLRWDKFSYGVTNDTVTISGGYRNGVSSITDTQVTYLIGCTLDTVHHRMDSFIFQYFKHLTLYQSGQTYDWHILHLTLAHIPYDTIDDSVMAIDLQGEQFLECITGYLSGYSFDTPCHNAPRAPATAGTDTVHQYAIRDTSKLRLQIEFVLRSAASSVPRNAMGIPALLVRYALASGSLKFTFPPLFEGQSLRICDVLGRPMLQKEIAAGATLYTLSPAQLESGLYFARLGEMTTSFVVP